MTGLIVLDFIIGLVFLDLLAAVIAQIIAIDTGLKTGKLKDQTLMINDEGKPSFADRVANSLFLFTLSDPRIKAFSKPIEVSLEMVIERNVVAKKISIGQLRQIFLEDSPRGYTRFSALSSMLTSISNRQKKQKKTNNK